MPKYTDKQWYTCIEKNGLNPVAMVAMREIYLAVKNRRRCYAQANEIRYTTTSWNAFRYFVELVTLAGGKYINESDYTLHERPKNNPWGPPRTRREYHLTATIYNLERHLEKASDPKYLDYVKKLDAELISG